MSAGVGEGIGSRYKISGMINCLHHLRIPIQSTPQVICWEPSEKKASRLTGLLASSSFKNPPLSPFVIVRTSVGSPPHASRFISPSFSLLLNTLPYESTPSKES